MPTVLLSRPIRRNIRYVIELEFEDDTGGGFDFTGATATLRGRYGIDETNVLFEITDVELNADDIDGRVRAIIPPDTTADLTVGKSVLLSLVASSGTQWNALLAHGFVRVEDVA